MGEIVWMGRRRDTGEVEEVGRGASVNLPAGFESVWPVTPPVQWRPNVVATSGDGTVTVAFAHEPNAPRTIPELTVPPLHPETAQALERRAQRQSELVDSIEPADIVIGPGPRVIGSTLQPEPGRFADTPLTAAEVTEPGWYWWRAGGRKRWRVIEVWLDVPGVFDAYMPGEEHVYTIGDDLTGTFIGPLRAPD